MTIRPATRSDLARLDELTVRFLSSTPYGELLGKPTRFFALVEQVLDLGVILVAELDGRVEGMLAQVALEHPISGEPYADEIAWWVEPERRAAGIGPRLLVESWQWAVAHGCTLHKMVAPAGSDIGKFYTRMGYQAVETAYQRRLSA